MARRRWWQGLLARVTISYALGSLLLSSIVAFAAFTIAQNRLLSEEQQQAVAQFRLNGLQVRSDLEAASPNATNEELGDGYRDLVETKVRRGNGASPLLVVTGFEPVGQVQLTTIPDELQGRLLTDPIALMRYRGAADDGGEMQLVLGLFLEDLDAKYYEVLSLGGLESTLTDLRRILIAVAAVASLAGAALGYYSARRALAPVTRVSNAARAIAAGDFKTRLDLQVDPELDVLSSSFNEMVDALRIRMERDERFTSDVSHELRSPLMTLTASVEVLERRKASLPDVAQRAVDFLREDLTRFEHLVEDLLEISRVDAGAVQLHLSTFALAEFLVNVIAQSRSPEIELNHPNRDRRLAVTADKRRLAQVVTNLIDNAMKYGGGATGISFRRIGDCVQIVVEDRGPGVAVDDRKRIFDRFSRAGTDAGRRGTDTGVGLGLSLVAEHIRLHGGRVWVTDRVDGKDGARFVVELPVGEHEDDDVEMAV